MTRLLFILLALTLVSCSTVEGVGKDISAGARTVRNAL
ncbi:entericidin, EcnA/B family [Rhodovulum sulfidophilum]|nr:entericidin, EcnA/B family [Rhodovulum sulfidophilum]MBK5923470.1 entericidin, EcnA/B family [Rhodovulum sulfidophilum]